MVNREHEDSNDNILNPNLNPELKNKSDELTKLYNRTAIYDFLENGFNSLITNYWSKKEEPSTDRYIGERRIADKICGIPREKLENKKISDFSLIMIDIDHFKKINDTYGHAIGDSVLVVLSSFFQEPNLLRKIDVAGRFGGDKFLIILPFTRPAQALQVAERIKQKQDKTTIV
jgi:PleD family two-component response regulator